MHCPDNQYDLFLYPTGHFGFTAVTFLIDFPFTHVIDFWIGATLGIVLDTPTEISVTGVLATGVGAAGTTGPMGAAD